MFWAARAQPLCQWSQAAEHPIFVSVHNGRIDGSQTNQYFEKGLCGLLLTSSFVGVIRSVCIPGGDFPALWQKLSRSSIPLYGSHHALPLYTTVSGCGWGCCWRRVLRMSRRLGARFFCAQMALLSPRKTGGVGGPAGKDAIHAQSRLHPFLAV